MFFLSNHFLLIIGLVMSTSSVVGVSLVISFRDWWYGYRTPYQWYSIDPRRYQYRLQLRIHDFFLNQWNRDVYENWYSINTPISNSTYQLRDLTTESEVLNYWYTQPVFKSEYQDLVKDFWILIRTNSEPSLNLTSAGSNKPYYSIHLTSPTGSQLLKHYWWLFIFKIGPLFQNIYQIFLAYRFLIRPKFYFYLSCGIFFKILQGLSFGLFYCADYIIMNGYRFLVKVNDFYEQRVIGTYYGVE